MSKEFIEGKTGSNAIREATRQHEQLSYLVSSSVQSPVNTDYIKKFAERNYISNDEFLNWVKTVLRTDNFISFYKYFRTPSPSASLIHTKIKEPLKRVFFADDSYFNYTVRDNNQVNPEELEDGFNEYILDKLLFSYNSILVHDLKDVNEPCRFLVDIEKVIAIDSDMGKIKRIAYTASMVDEDGREILGYAYIDKDRYAFFDKDYREVSEAPHDLGYCPAFYITKEAFGQSNDVVRKSLFSFVRAEMEEYDFFKTIQRMTDPNGAIPTITQLDVTNKNAKKDGGEGANYPMTSHEIKNQQAEFKNEFPQSENLIQVGSITKVPIIKKQDGSVDVELAKNLINFFYLPVESMKYLDSRIKDLERQIIVSVLGDYADANENAKNELQVSKSYVSKQDMLRYVSASLSRIRQKSDKTMLALKYGKDAVDVDVFYGSDFFIETQEELLNQFQLSPNAIERKNLLIRMAQTRNKFNPNKALRDSILYKLLPYASDIDFDKAADKVSPEVFELQTRFSYWISMFEAHYGDLVAFWEAIDQPEAQKLIEINNLLNNLITNGTEKNRAS